jgi:hypothetical protein
MVLLFKYEEEESIGRRDQRNEEGEMERMAMLKG